jgi:HEAT repeat protein
MDIRPDELIRTLGSDNVIARANAAENLSNYPCKDSVEALIGALTDPSDNVRNKAVEALYVMAVKRECRIDPRPLLKILKNEPGNAGLKKCLCELGLQREVDKIIDSFEES